MMNERKPRAPKPSYWVDIVTFRYSHTDMPASSSRNPYSTAPPPKKPKKEKPPTYIWIMTYRSIAPDDDSQKKEIKEAVINKFTSLGHLVMSAKYVKTLNPCLYFQVKTSQGIQLVEIYRVK